jgi:hypothetical protein
MGEMIVRGRHYWPVECVTVRSEELERMATTLRDRLDQRSDTLAKSHQLQLTVDKVIFQFSFIISLSLIININWVALKKLFKGQ